MPRGSASLRRVDVATDRDVRSGQRSVRLLFRRGDEDFGADLEVRSAARRVAGNRNPVRHDDLLLAVLVLDQQLFAVLASDHGRDIRIGHGAARPAVPLRKPIGHHAALCIQEDVNGERLLRAVRLRHGRDADERAFLDVGEGRLEHGVDPRRIRELDLQLGAVTGLDRQNRAIDLLDLAADADGLRLLREGRGCGEHEGQSRGCERALSYVVHYYLPEIPRTDEVPAMEVKPQDTCAYSAAYSDCNSPVTCGRIRRSRIQFLARSASTIDRSSSVTTGRTPNQSENPRTA